MQFTAWYWKLGRDETFTRFDEVFGPIYNGYAEKALCLPKEESEPEECKLSEVGTGPESEDAGVE
jgi:hypothetical protein